ncbi:MAG: mechanosensitive ion channel [Rhizobiaceae bacterium]|nr:mechanosensitive ion channel [Rhizobiaceae bacterium]
MTKLSKLLALLLLAITALLSTVPVQAQLLIPKSETSNATSGLDLLLDEARRDGSTVVVISPGNSGTGADASASNMRAEMFLKARKRIKEIVQSSPQLASNMAGTLKAASPDGSWFWVFRALGTALLGLIIGWYATRPIIMWSFKNVLAQPDVEPQTTADKIAYLLSRAMFALIYVIIYFAVAMLVAVILDSGHEPTRRIIFEVVAWYCVYRFMRHGVSWNIFAGDMPKYRLVNLSNDEAVRLHTHWQIGVGVFACYAAFARFAGITGEDQIAAGLIGVLTPENIKLLQISSAMLASLILIIYVLKDWKTWQQVFAPSDSGAAFYTWRRNLARLVPIIAVVYSTFAMAMFVYRLALDQPSPGVVIAAPFAIFYVAIIVYGLVLIIIQAMYNRRIRRFEALAEAERQRAEQQMENVDTDAGEEMQVGPSSVTSAIFEYQPMFRGLFEAAALAVVIAVALGELARVWGVPVGSEGNIWAAFLDIILAAILCWLAYSAVRIFVDKKLEEEGGDFELEMGGDGGGAGATRTATLLPIMRYAMMIVIFSVAAMVILSRMGVDVAPIFAGAGVVGIAVGFGAQTLIRDIFSGAFFLLDDAFRRGEYVDIEGVKGTVEKISIRSFQLRHHLGALHTIPFGEIKQLTNYSRDWVLMKLPLRVTYDTDTEKVRKLVKKLGQELLNHPQVGHTFMQPLKSQGVYKMEDSAMIIRVKFMTKPGEQFVTRKVVYESIQDLFAREGIKFAHKEVTVRLADKSIDDLTEEEKQAVSSAARSIIDAEAEEALAAAGGKPADGGR